MYSQCTIFDSQFSVSNKMCIITWLAEELKWIKISPNFHARRVFVVCLCVYSFFLSWNFSWLVTNSRKIRKFFSRIPENLRKLSTIFFYSSRFYFVCRVRIEEDFVLNGFCRDLQVQVASWNRDKRVLIVKCDSIIASVCVLLDMCLW